MDHCTPEFIMAVYHLVYHITGFLANNNVCNFGQDLYLVTKLFSDYTSTAQVNMYVKKISISHSALPIRKDKTFAKIVKIKPP